MERESTKAPERSPADETTPNPAGLAEDLSATPCGWQAGAAAAYRPQSIGGSAGPALTCIQGRFSVALTGTVINDVGVNVGADRRKEGPRTAPLH